MLKARLLFVPWGAGLILAALGCGGQSVDYSGVELARVSGKVTLGGQPLAEARVVFRPTEPGKAGSTGQTDAAGNYTLQYDTQTSGAIVGTHTVTISTARGLKENEQGQMVLEVPEKVPAKYNTKTTLKQEVAPGSNTINFELDSQGEIIQPKDLETDQ